MKLLLTSSCQGSKDTIHLFRRKPHLHISFKGSYTYTPLPPSLSSQPQPFIPACFGFVLLFYYVLIVYESEIFIRNYTNLGYISSAREVRLSSLQPLKLFKLTGKTGKLESIISVSLTVLIFQNHIIVFGISIIFSLNQASSV